MRQPTLVGIIVGFVVLTAVFRLLELTRAPDKRLRLLRGGYWTDLAYWLFTPLVTRTATAVAVGIAVAPIAYLVCGGPADSTPSITPPSSSIGCPRRGCIRLTTL